VLNQTGCGRARTIPPTIATRSDITIAITIMMVVIVVMPIVMLAAITVFVLLFLNLLHPFFLFFLHPSDSFRPFTRPVLPVKGLR
jgi:hypothetical protein